MTEVFVEQPGNTRSVDFFLPYSFYTLLLTWSLRRLSAAAQFWLAVSRLADALLPTRGTSWLLDIMAEWVEISAQATLTVLSRLTQRELLSLFHHLPSDLGHLGTVLSKSVHNKVRIFFSSSKVHCFFLVSTTLQVCIVSDNFAS